MSRRVVALTVTLVVAAIAFIATGATLWVRADVDGDDDARDASATPSTVEIDELLPRTPASARPRSDDRIEPDAAGVRPRRRATTTTTSTTIPERPECTVDRFIYAGVDAPQVECLEDVLAFDGYLTAAADTVYDDAAVDAVQAFQAENGLEVDGVVGPQTAVALGLWTRADRFPPDPATCPAVGHAAVVDRALQRGWLCSDGAVVREFPITSARSQPDPGTYPVYAKDLRSSSNFTGQYSEMTHFVAFTRGKYQGARIAFHSVPTYRDGSYVQPLESVGTAERFGDSSGCIRVLPDDAIAIWDWLTVDDTVIVLT